MLVITQAPLGRRWHVPATPGDHRGVIKAAVPVVNRAASKGSRGWGERESKRKGNEGGLLEDCLSFVLYLACFAHCDLPVWHWIPQKTVYYNKVKKTSPKIYAELNKNFEVNKMLFCVLLTKRKNGIHSNTLQEYSANSLLFQSHKNKLCGTERAIASVMFSQREQKKVYCTTKLSQSHPKTSAGMQESL